MKTSRRGLFRLGVALCALPFVGKPEPVTAAAEVAAPVVAENLRTAYTIEMSKAMLSNEGYFYALGTEAVRDVAALGYISAARYLDGA